jgi:hypothetical protein
LRLNDSTSHPKIFPRRNGRTMKALQELKNLSSQIIACFVNGLVRYLINKSLEDMEISMLAWHC